MLGEQISELMGKIVSRWVLEVEDPSIETTVEAKGTYKKKEADGSFKETEVAETLTFVSSPRSSEVLHGKGKGIIITIEHDEVAIYTGEAVGIISSSGTISWRGSVFFRTTSNGKLAFLNNIVGVFEAEIDSNHNFNQQIWQWN
jgi:hypothetical protein